MLVSDVDGERARVLATRIGAEVVAPEDAIGADCDVYAPCALGGTLNAETVARLRSRVVAGCANNQLAEPEDSERLRKAGILYAPDFVINAGGVLYAWGNESLGWDLETVETRLVGIGDTLSEIYAAAESDEVGTHAAAVSLARSRALGAGP